jgi:hypothetical protein
MVARVPSKPRPRKTPFVKGHQLSVGNSGYTLQQRREKRFITAALTDKLLKIVNSKSNGKNKIRRMDRFIEKWIQKAEKGDIFAINSIADRIEGRPTQAHEHSGKSGGPIGIVNTSMTLSEMMRAYAQLRQEDDE